MKTNIFKSVETLSKKQIKSEKKETKKAVNNALKDYEANINAAFNLVIKDPDQRARNVANAAKGKYRTALEVVANCFPYQTEAGALCAKRKNDDGIIVWSEKKLTASSARGIVRDALKHFTDTLGNPCPLVVIAGVAVK